MLFATMPLAAMTLAEVRRKWNRRHAGRLEEESAPQPNPLAMRFANRVHGGTLLDAACGFGAGTAALLGRVDRVIGVDLSDTALAAARRHFGDDPRLNWIQGDVSQLPWKANYFSAVCAFGFTDWVFLRRAPELLRPGGIFMYQGFSRRQLTLKPTLAPDWTSTPESISALFPGWEKLACEESGEAPYRVSFAARRP